MRLSSEPNRTLLVVGYGSLLSGYGMLAERRGGGSRLVARDAFPVTLTNARRGLAKPSSHGRYLAMDLEPVRPDEPIVASTSRDDGAGRIGALGLVFDREWAALISRREEYCPEKFLELVALADRAGKPLGEFLLEIAERTKFNLLAYRRALREMLDYTSHGYIFHPVPLKDGRVAIAAIGSGYEGSGDPDVRSKRNEYGMDRVLKLAEALKVRTLDLDHDGQIGYFVECILGGMHGVGVGDLMEEFELQSELRERLRPHLRRAVPGERERFMKATSLNPAGYTEAFGGEPHRSVASLLRFVDE
jgi:hypothetical protein